jgi:hypothetical protein
MDDEFDLEQTYSAAMDSVNLINRMYDAGETVSEDDADAIQRNKDHLKIMMIKSYWTSAQDLSPFQAAIDRTS